MFGCLTFIPTYERNARESVNGDPALRRERASYRKLEKDVEEEVEGLRRKLSYGKKVKKRKIERRRKRKRRRRKEVAQKKGR